MTTLDAFLIPPVVPKSQVDCIMQWRELWTDHAYWTRSELWAVHVFSRKLAGTWTNFKVEGVTNQLPGFDQTVARLLASVSGMRELLAPYCGDNVAVRFAELMTAHLELDGQFVKAASNGASDEAASAEVAWHSNARELNDLLAGAGVSLDGADLEAMLQEHLALTKAEGTAIVGGDHAGR